VEEELVYKRYIW